MTGWAPAYDRHLWLAQAVTVLRPLVSSAGLVLPKRVLVQSGPTVMCEHGPALGQCQPSTARLDRLPLITINNCIGDSVIVLSTLLHELVHAADDCRSDHGEWFVAWARALGLDGPIPSTHAGPVLLPRLRAIASSLGVYPAAGFGYDVTTGGQVAA